MSISNMHVTVFSSHYSAFWAGYLNTATCNKHVSCTFNKSEFWKYNGNDNRNAKNIFTDIVVFKQKYELLYT